MPHNIVFIVDASPSMRRSYNDLLPSKLEAVKEILLHRLAKMVDEDSSTRIGMVAFYGRALPLLPLTRDKRMLIDTVFRIRILGEGSAPGDGLVEAVKLLRRGEGSKRAIMITDGGFNAGIPLDIAAVYARNSGVTTTFIVIGGRLKDTDLYYIDKTIKYCGGEKYIVENKAELLQALYKATRTL